MQRASAGAERSLASRQTTRIGARIAAIMDRSSINVRDRGAAYRKAGWNRFGPGSRALHAEGRRFLLLNGVRGASRVAAVARVGAIGGCIKDVVSLHRCHALRFVRRNDSSWDCHRELSFFSGTSPNVACVTQSTRYL